MARLHLHLDPLGGVAGDMVLAALLDAWPEHAADTFEAMRAAGLPDDWRAELVAHDDGVLAGRRVVIEGPAEGDHHHGPGRFRAIRARLAEAALPEPVRARAIAIFTLLAEAEARVHGIALDEVHFHELADWDSIADVVGSAWLLEALATAQRLLRAAADRQRPDRDRPWRAAGAGAGGGPAARGPADGRRWRRGRARDADRRRDPAPSPGCVRGLPAGSWRVARSGIGFGTRRLPGLSNVLRVLAYEPAAAGGRADDRVAVLAFEVDDQSPEELALGLDALRAADGVLDVIQLAAFGKKGRLATQVQVLARPERLDAGDRALLCRDDHDRAALAARGACRAGARDGQRGHGRGCFRGQAGRHGRAASAPPRQRSSRCGMVPTVTRRVRGGGGKRRRVRSRRTWMSEPIGGSGRRARRARRGRGRGQRRGRQHDARRGRRPPPRARGGDAACGLARGAAGSERARARLRDPRGLAARGDRCRRVRGPGVPEEPGQSLLLLQDQPLWHDRPAHARDDLLGHQPRRSRRLAPRARGGQGAPGPPSLRRGRDRQGGRARAGPEPRPRRPGRAAGRPLPLEPARDRHPGHGRAVASWCTRSSG